MKKMMCVLIIIGIFVITGCDNTTTSNLLDGSFIPADTSPPNILGPENGEVVLNLTANLSWTAKSGAAYYIIDVAADAAFTIPIAASPITVTAPTTYYTLTLPSAGTYYWRVRASATAAGLYASSYFDAREDCLYVYFPYDPGEPDAKPDDTGKTGNIESPFQSINHAMAEAGRLGISTVKVATRGEITAGNFAAYIEYFVFQPGVNLNGGYLYQAGPPPTMTRHASFPDDLVNNPYETRLEARFAGNITLEKIFTPMVFEGFAIRTESTPVLTISYCGKELTVLDCVLVSKATSSPISLRIFCSDSLIIHNDLSTIDVGSTSGLYIYEGYPEIIDNTIHPGSGTTSRGVDNKGNPTLINNIIIAGNALSGFSYGVSNDTDTAPIIINNIIIGGDAATMSCGIYNYAGATPVAINNIITTIDTPGTGYGVSGSGAGDVNYYYNCIYGNGGTDYTNITADSTNVNDNPDLDADYNLTASSPPTVTGGGVIDPFTLAGITPLDEYLLDITGAARTPAYVADSTDVGWSMGAYEY